MLGVAMEAGVGKELSNLALRLPFAMKCENFEARLVQPRGRSDTCILLERRTREGGRVGKKQVAVGVSWVRLQVR